MTIRRIRRYQVEKDFQPAWFLAKLLKENIVGSFNGQNLLFDQNRLPELSRLGYMRSGDDRSNDSNISIYPGFPPPGEMFRQSLDDFGPFTSSRYCFSRLSTSSCTNVQIIQKISIRHFSFPLLHLFWRKYFQLALSIMLSGNKCWQYFKIQAMFNQRK